MTRRVLSTVAALGARRAGVAALALVGVVAGGCEQAPPAADARPLVVASFYPLYEFAREVAGDRMQAHALVPPGVEPHDWEPAPRDIATLRQARVLVVNGGGLEPWADRLAADLPDTIVVNTTAGLALTPPAGGRAPGAPHAHGPDPHVWLDPVLAQAQVDAVREGLTRADPDGAATYARNARAYTERLAALHGAFEEGLRQCARRDLVVSHAAFGHLARRYGLRQVPVMGLTPEAEPSPADLARIVRFARQEKVQYIFFETLVSPRLAETLAREVGARTLVLNPVEGLTTDEAAAGKGYVTLMEDNLRNLRTALDCR